MADKKVDSYTEDKRVERGEKLSAGDPTESGKISPVAIETYIKGIHFPATKEDLINQAKTNDVPDNVLEIIDRLKEQEYNSPTDIAKSVSEVE